MLPFEDFGSFLKFWEGLYEEGSTLPMGMVEAFEVYYNQIDQEEQAFQVPS